MKKSFTVKGNLEKWFDCSEKALNVMGVSNIEVDDMFFQIIGNDPNFGRIEISFSENGENSIQLSIEAAQQEIIDQYKKAVSAQLKKKETAPSEPNTVKPNTSSLKKESITKTSLPKGLKIGLSVIFNLGILFFIVVSLTTFVSGDASKYGWYSLRFSLFSLFLALWVFYFWDIHTLVLKKHLNQTTKIVVIIIGVILMFYTFYLGTLPVVPDVDLFAMGCLYLTN